MPRRSPTALGESDRREMIDLVLRYARAVDERDFEQLREVFTAKAALDTGRGLRSGLVEIIEAMQGLERYESTVHVVGRHDIEVGTTGDEAVGTAVCTAHHFTDHGDHHTDAVMHIRYHDRYVRTPGGWRIAARRLEPRLSRAPLPSRDDG